MKKGLFGFVCVLLFCVGFGQSRDSAAARVLEAPLSHPVNVSAAGIRLELRGVYVSDGLLWLTFSATNRSAIDFKANGMRIEIRDRKALKRRARQEVGMRVLWRGEPGVLKADSAVRFCVGLVPRVPGKAQEIVVEWVERDGDRRVALRVRSKRFLKAKKV